MEFKFTYMTEDNNPTSLNDELSLLSEDNDDSTIIENIKKHQETDYSSYQLPCTDLLIPQNKDDYDHSEEIQRISSRIVDTLATFDVVASLTNVDRGPRITRYHIVPAKGVKVSRILCLENDIALSIGAHSIRIEAPIPGKTAIGIEIPNDHESIVRLSDLIDTDEFKSKKHKTTVCLGKSVDGSPVFSNIESLPHLLIAGATGTGKSMCIDTFILSMLYKASPDELKFILIDTKKVEFSKYNGIPHLLVPVITDIKQAVGALSWALDEMNRRYELLANANARNIADYNDVVKSDTSLGNPLPRIVIIIDELADLMITARSPVEDLVQILTQKARAAGIHLIISTQRPNCSVITSTIKANIPARISFRVPSCIDSRTIINTAGAQTLLSRGDMLYTSGSLMPTRIQGAYVSDEEIKRIISFVKSQTQGESYDEEAMKRILSEVKRVDNKRSNDRDFGNEHNSKSESNSLLDDAQFLEAVDVALSQGQVSTALLQRRLSIGFGKAARFIDFMEAMGIVSEKNGAKPRNVLITRDEWVEKMNRVDIATKTTKTENHDTDSLSFESLFAIDEPEVKTANHCDFTDFILAVDIVARQGSVSTAFLQRKLSIGFGKAARFIDRMEELGIVSEKNGAKPREVLIDKETWLDTIDKLK